jgi:hypothetical protein
VSSGFAARVDDALLGSGCLGDHRVTVVMGRWAAEMSFVVAAPEQVQAAAHELAGIRALLAGATASAAAPTTAVAAAGSGWGIGPGSRVVEALPAPRVSPFPAVFQDVSLVVSVRVPAQAVADAVREGPGDCWKTLSCSTSSPGPQIGEDRMSLTFALRFRAGSHADRGRRRCGPRCCGTSRGGGGRRCIARIEPRAAKAARSGSGQNLGGAVAARGVTVGQPPRHTTLFEPRAELHCAQSKVNP